MAIDTTGNIEVLSPGIFTSIQDGGRNGFRKFGVPVSGYMDSMSAALANALLNNALEAPVMEITLVGPVLKFNSTTVMAIAGADLAPMLNGGPVFLNQAVSVQVNDVLSFGKLRYGARAYLAVKGGFLTPKIMGSHAYYKPITGQSRIEKGDTIPVPVYANKKEGFSRTSVRADRQIFFSEEVECMKGPEFSLLSGEQHKRLFTSSFVVSAQSNRMGYRLDHTKLQYPSGFGMLTSSVIPGTVQLTPSGQLIVLMRDAQTTGGYPRILQLTLRGVNQLAQKKPGDPFTFTLREQDGTK